MSEATITVLPGDGVGPEVSAQAVKALRAVEKRYGHTFTLHEGLVGLDAIAAEGSAISDATFETCAQSDAILFGAVGALPAAEHRADGPRPEQALFRLRKEFGFFANLRPVRPAEALYEASSLKPECLKGADMVFVRELSAGLYYGHMETVPGKPSEIRQRGGRTEAVDTLLYTEEEIERVVRVAFDIAAGRRARVTSVDKANVLSSSVLWRQVVDRVAADHPGVTHEHMLVDACAMRLIRTPAEFDVIVTENLFGDILTDEASMLTGSIGMLPSASLGVRRTAGGRFGLYEPVHGSAPDIAGQDAANPVGAVLSAALLLRHSLGLEREAAAVEEAVEDVMRDGYRVPDLHDEGCTVVGTEEFGRLIVHRLEARP
ncbi:3-isopropylmalate dehydrogenase [Streptomyces diacarni]|uniref:3-isopropylmalate dehydrogenase n=1 Tax=Streptomyces diacarni TaxID=2800381 RepID=A0A367EDI4_9ACTN|nr:3-isopropylmalate dehydrogenase [Streptomyces diacarni]RCG15705.1 3-isopropylmalate dehydrogenase [Streptomyces diacarni]